MKFNFLFLALLLFVSAVKAETPNIILMITDDQGYGDFGAKGNHLLKTPHIDAMAGRSFEMTRFYVNAVCSPTRASLMTGRSSYRTGVTDTWKGRSTMRAEEFTMAEMLKTKGYSTGLFGKWHLGDNYPCRPMDQGFDESLYHLGGGLAQPADPLENDRRYSDPVLFKNGKKFPTKGYCCDVYYEEAIKWFSEENKKGKPFFAYIATNTPHTPLHDVPEKWYNYYKDMDLGKANFDQNKGHKIEGKDNNDRTARIYAMISNIDENVGKVFDALDKLKITKDTIVIYMNDNGPDGYRYVSGFKGKKSMSTEGGLRSPLWLHWPQKFQAGGKSDLVSAHFDIMPTIAEITGAKMPENKTIDGKSILPALKGEKQKWEDRIFILQSHRGTRPNKLENSAIISQNWKIETDRKGKMALFDMKNDPFATKNLLDQKPEIKNKLLLFYDEWFKSLDSEYPNMWSPLSVTVDTNHEKPCFLTRQEMRIEDNLRWSVNETNGEWHLEIAKSGEYEISFQMLEDASSVNAELLINGKTLKAQDFQNQKVMSFGKVKLDSGKAVLRINVKADGKDAGPWHAFIK
ncbi:MAG: arylsulfatase [Lentisphaeraceae bacterium]|nr:arylsulfatase [Lentisphaeraceae bacterium]